MNEVPIRPLLMLRVTFDMVDHSRGWLAGDMGAWVQGLFRAEQAALYEDLTEARERGAPQKEVDAIGQRLRWSIRSLRDIDDAMLLPDGPRNMRIYRGGHALWVQRVLRDEQADLYVDLGDLRTEGRAEDDPDIVEVRRQLEWSVALLRVVDGCLVSLVGPDQDPR